MNTINDVKTGVESRGKKFIVYNNGKIIGSSYLKRSAEIILEKSLGTYIEKRGRKASQSSDLNFKDCKNPSIELQIIPSILNGCGAKLLRELAGYVFPDPLSIIILFYVYFT